MIPRISPTVLPCVLIGFDGPTLPDTVAALLRDGLLGVALFRRNLIDAPQVRALTAAIRDAAQGRVVLIAVDQEGGRVQRLRHILPLVPTMAEVGRTGPDAARNAGAAIGRDLAGLGFNLNFAPVLDVHSNPNNPIIGDRAFGNDPETVAVCAAALVEGLEGEGVLACGKHFPGHGDASADSHLELPLIDADADLIATRELPPFEAMINAGIGMLMTAHCLYPALDARHPATLSRAVIDGLLRRRLGFEGVVITDDLGMKAVADRYAADEMISLALDAGVDVFMHCGGGGEGMALAAAMTRMLEDGVIDADRLEQSRERIAFLTHRFPLREPHAL